MISVRILGLLHASNLCLGRYLILNNHRTHIATCQRCISYANILSPRPKNADDAQELGTVAKEFPRPKENLQLILYEVALKLESLEWQPKFTFQRISGNGMWKAHLSVSWPEKFVVEAEATQKSEAEKIVALLACKKIKEYGVLDSKLKPIIQNQLKIDHDGKMTLGNIFGLVAQKFESKHWHPQYVSQPLKVGGISTAKVGWKTTLSMKWPKNHIVEGVGLKKSEAEAAAATNALSWLREQDVLDRRGYPILYSKAEKKEFLDSRRAPVPIAISSNARPLLEEVLQEYQSLKPLLDKLSDSENLDMEEEERTVYWQRPPPQQWRNQELFQQYQQRTNSRDEDVIAISQKQRALPTFHKREEILELIRKNQVVVLSGETGCGKTTQIPQYILDEYIKMMNGASCNIVVTQPRRISAISIAHRIADERQEQVGDTVGYQVRLQSVFPRGNGSILFCSTGVLLQRLHSDPNLENISHLIVDEIHERGVQTDFLLALLQNVIRCNPNLKIVLMSATLNAEMFSSYFNDCPMITVPGFMYDVTEHFLPEIVRLLNFQPRVSNNSNYPLVDYDLVTNLIKYIDRSQPSGAILVFLPGWQDIKSISERLEYAFGHSSGHLICPVHSRLSSDEQRLIFSRPKIGTRKIVLATNIAETSITIDDVVYVIDSGCHKETAFDAERGVACLETEWISKANAKQRRGRAGRVQPGHCFRLYDKKTLQHFDDYPLPEILRTPLEKVVLDCKLYCPDALAVDFLSQAPQPPDTETIEKAINDLQQLKILDASEKLTPLGKKVAYFSTHPRLSVALVTAAFLRCLQPVVTVAAVLSATRNPFVGSLDSREQIKQIKKKYDSNRHSDHLAMVDLYNAWEETTPDNYHNNDFCRRNRLHYHGMKFIKGLHELIYNDLEEAGLVEFANEDLYSESNSFVDSDAMVLSALCTALYPNIIRVYKGDMGKCSIKVDAIVPMTLYGMEVALSKESVVSKELALPSPWLIYFTAIKSQQRRQILVREVSSVPSLLLFLSANQEATTVEMGTNVCLTVGDEARMKFVCSSEDAGLLRSFQHCFSSLFWHFLAASKDPSLADDSVERLRKKFLATLDALLRDNYDSIDTKRNETTGHFKSLYDPDEE